MKISNVIFLAFILAVGLTSKAEAILQLDQSFLNGSGAVAAGDLDPRLAQTFTVGLNGKLNKVNVGVDILKNAFLDIYPTTGGVPADFGSSTLASVALADVNGSGLIGVDLSPFSLNVKQGDSLAIVLHGDQIQWEAGVGNPSDYSRGAAFVADVNNGWALNTVDQHFQTFVGNAVPEPPRQHYFSSVECP